MTTSDVELLKDFCHGNNVSSLRFYNIFQTVFLFQTEIDEEGELKALAKVVSREKD